MASQRNWYWKSRNDNSSIKKFRPIRLIWKKLTRKIIEISSTKKGCQLRCCWKNSSWWFKRKKWMSKKWPKIFMKISKCAVSAASIKPRCWMWPYHKYRQWFWIEVNFIMRKVTLSSIYLHFQPIGLSMQLQLPKKKLLKLFLQTESCHFNCW